MSKAWIWNSLKIIVAGAIFWYLFRTNQLDFGKVQLAFRRIDLFAAATLLITAGALLTVQRWRIILASQDISMGFWLATKLTLIGYFFSAALPGTISGDFIKAYYLAKGEQQKVTHVCLLGAGS